VHRRLNRLGGIEVALDRGRGLRQQILGLLVLRGGEGRVGRLQDGLVIQAFVADVRGVERGTLRRDVELRDEVRAGFPQAVVVAHHAGPERLDVGARAVARGDGAGGAVEHVPAMRM
jgi:hypothetical protein